MTDESEVVRDAAATLARRIQRALDAADANPLPKPGERHNASSIPVSDEALATLLADARMAEVFRPCEAEDCENCNMHHLVWWDCCNALDRSTRIALQSWLVAEGYGLPEAPWEDVEPDGGVGGWLYPGPRA